MDNLTHTATGLFLARTGLNRWTPGGSAILLLAANVPDADVISAAAGWVQYLRFHRHITHSLAAMPVLAVICVALVRGFGVRVRWARGFLLALAGVASHLLLDWTNVYGIRALLPFSSEWLRLDINSVVDLWIWTAVALALGAPFISRLVGSEIKSREEKTSHYGRGWAAFALCFIAVYSCGRAVLHERAVSTVNSRVYRGYAPVRAAAFPDPVNPLRWRGLVETREFYAEAEVNLAGSFDPIDAVFMNKPPNAPPIQAARRSDTMRAFTEFSQFPLWRLRPAPQREGSEIVELLDLRFGTPQEPGFMAAALVDARGRVEKTSFQFGRIRPR